MLKGLWDLLTQSQVKKQVKQTSLDLVNERNKSFKVSLESIDAKIERLKGSIERIDKINETEELYVEQLLAHEHYLKFLHSQLEALVESRNDLINKEINYQADVLSKLDGSKLLPTKETKSDSNQSNPTS